MIKAANDKTTTSKRDGRMFFGVSLHSWENTMVVSLIIAGGFAFLAGLATWAVVRLQRIEIAESNARQKEAELQLLQLRFPRSLDIEKFEAAVKKMPPPTSFEVLYDANAPDASFLASLIWGIFFNAKWPTQQTMGAVPLKAPPPNNLLYVNRPWTEAAGAGPWGISVVTTTGPKFDDPLSKELIKALAESVKGPPAGLTLGYQTSEPLPPGGIRIIVGPKIP